MKFNWEKFMNEDNKIAVYCKTEEEAIDFCKQMDAHGLKWCEGGSYLNNNNWFKYKERTCYNSEGQFGTEECEFSKILEWSDYMKKYPIDYLKYGYVVEFESGELGMYMPSQEGDCFVLERIGCCYYFKNFYDKKNLKVKDDNYVIKIYGYANFGSDTRTLTTRNRPLIWERPEEVKKMTVSEICKELGYKVEIVAEEK